MQTRDQKLSYHYLRPPVQSTGPCTRVGSFSAVLPWACAGQDDIQGHCAHWYLSVTVCHWGCVQQARFGLCKYPYVVEDTYDVLFFSASPGALHKNESHLGRFAICHATYQGMDSNWYHGHFPPPCYKPHNKGETCRFHTGLIHFCHKAGLNGVILSIPKYPPYSKAVWPAVFLGNSL